jgi:hypothetical protein
VGSAPSHQKWLPHPCFNQAVSSTKAIESELFGGISLRKPIYYLSLALMGYPIRLLPWKFHLLAGKRADHHFNARGVKRYGWMVQWLINFTMATCSSGVSAYGK